MFTKSYGCFGSIILIPADILLFRELINESDTIKLLLFKEVIKYNLCFLFDLILTRYLYV